MRKSRKEQGQFHRRPNIALRLAAILLVLVCLSVWLMNGLFAKYRTSDEGGDGARVITFGNLYLIESGNFINGKAKLIPGVDLVKDVWVNFTGSESSTYVFVEVELPDFWKLKKDSNGNISFEALNGRINWAVADGWIYMEPEEETEVPDTEGSEGTEGEGSESTEGSEGTEGEGSEGTETPPIQEEPQTNFVFYCELAPGTALSRDFIAGNGNSDDPANNHGKIHVDSTIVKSEMQALTKLTNPLTINLQATVVQSNGFADPEAAWESILAGRN